jgi:hypothetical protein
LARRLVGLLVGWLVGLWFELRALYLLGSSCTT